LGISNTIIPNVYNFAKEPEEFDMSSCKLKKETGLKNKDIFILQPTRIVPRKWIERSIEIVQHLKLKNSALVISHTTGDEGDEYYQRIMEYSKNMGVKIVTIDHLIDNHFNKNNEKNYTIADAYKCADLITYPSGYEGFGNAFLEAIYFRKPIVVNRYSIYIADIEPKGFDVITLDGFVTDKTIQKIRQVLDDEEYLSKMVKKNYDLAKQFFSYEVLEKKLIYIINTFE